MSSQERRKKKLIEPRIQKRFVLLFLSTTALALLVQALVVSYLLLLMADRLPNDGIELKGELIGLLARSLTFTMLLLTPLTLAVGIASTHKVVGPLYRFRVYLTQLVQGERPQPCKIRQDDELQDFCALLNQATEPLRCPETPTAPPREVAA
jgi:hypothetical protein